MKLKLILSRRNQDGTVRKVVFEGTTEDGTLSTLKDLWEAERAINSYSSVRCHVEVVES